MSKVALLRIRKTLSKHHSKDQAFLRQIKIAMANNASDANQEYYPWRCHCGRINKKWAVECAICYSPWSEGTRHPTQPKPKEEYNWNAQEWEEWDNGKSRSASRSSTRYRQDYQDYSAQMPYQSSSKAKGKGKKGKMKNVVQTAQTSPFQADSAGFTAWPTLDSSAFTPSSSLTPSPFALTGTSSLITERQEWAEALRKAYPDPSTMPEETKKLVEKTEKDYGRRGIKNLHQASTYLGKVKEHLGDVTDKRRAHRSLWMKHLAHGIQVWESQLEDYRKHQANLAEQAAKARCEISATSRMIQQLSCTAGGATAASAVLAAAQPPTVNVDAEDTVEETVDKDEETLRQQLQNVLRSCAGSLGLEIATKKTEEPSQMEMTKPEEVDPPNKRPRSMEPFGGTPAS